MKRTDFHYHLPEHLIARFPTEQRSGSRLLQLDRARPDIRQDRLFTDLPSLLAPGDLLVFNNTQVIPARLYGHKATGGQVEILVERITESHECVAQVRASKAPKPGSQLILADQTPLTMVGRQGAMFRLRSANEPLADVLDRLGQMPLPPYMERGEQALDKERYQTVYAQRPGAVAAPTAGLHFDEPLLAQLAQRGVDSAYVTLHVGAGTFQPVRADDIREHQMHSEWLQVSAEVVSKIASTKAKGGRVIAVGTTSVRCLETAAKMTGGLANETDKETLSPYQGDTDIFIYPGYEFQVIDGLITNFHLPESTLIMLVSAMVGREPVLAAYQHAVQQEYRFFSYGDAMLIL